MKKQRFSVYQILVGVIMVLVLLIGSLMVIKKPAPKPIINTEVNTPTKIDSIYKPVFQKEGELRFLEAKTLQQIAIIDIEVADSDFERERGLMYRDTMAANQGMLFLMQVEEIQSFWMKNTPLSLDIIYVNNDKRIVSIHPSTKPFSLDQIVSQEPALFVVEVNAGFAKQNGIKKGDFVSF